VREAHEPPYFATVDRRILDGTQVEKGVPGLPGLQVSPGHGEKQIRIGRAFAKPL
jgi:hypothetical protein